MSITINYDLFIVVESDDKDFYKKDAPKLFKALIKHNVLFSIMNNDADGSIHLRFIGQKNNIINVIKAVWANDDGIMMDLYDNLID